MEEHLDRLISCDCMLVHTPPLDMVHNLEYNPLNQTYIPHWHRGTLCRSYSSRYDVDDWLVDLVVWSMTFFVVFWVDCVPPIHFQKILHSKVLSVNHGESLSRHILDYEMKWYRMRWWWSTGRNGRNWDTHNRVEWVLRSVMNHWTHRVNRLLLHSIWYIGCEPANK